MLFHAGEAAIVAFEGLYIGGWWQAVNLRGCRQATEHEKTWEDAYHGELVSDPLDRDRRAEGRLGRHWSWSNRRAVPVKRRSMHCGTATTLVGNGSDSGARRIFIRPATHGLRDLSAGAVGIGIGVDVVHDALVLMLVMQQFVCRDEGVATGQKGRKPGISPGPSPIRAERLVDLLVGRLAQPFKQRMHFLLGLSELLL